MVDFSLQLQNDSQLNVQGLRGAASAWLCSLLESDTTCCCVVSDENLVSTFEQDIRLFSSKPTLTYPGYEIPPYTPLSPDQQTTAARLSCLYQLLENNTPNNLVVSVEALMRRVVPKNILSRHVELAISGEECDLQQLIASLVGMGYEQVSFVRNVGDFSVRGGIIDIFPPSFVDSTYTVVEGPVRLDFFGDLIESIRLFEPISQRSVSEIDEVLLLPVSDIIFDQQDSAGHNRTVQLFKNLTLKESVDWDQLNHLVDRVANRTRFAGIEFFLPLFYSDNASESATLFDYLPADTTLVLINPNTIHETAKLVDERIEANYVSAEERGFPALEPQKIFLPSDSITKKFSSYRSLRCSDFDTEVEDSMVIRCSNHQPIKQDIHLNRRKSGVIAPLAARLTKLQDEGGRVVLCGRSAKHTATLGDMLGRHQMQVIPVEPPLTPEKLETLPKSENLFLCTHPLSSGFSLLDEQLHIFSEIELFGEKRITSRKKIRHPQGEPVTFSELNHGDIVVHRTHGLGIYRDIITLTLNSIPNDFMLIEYRDGDKLYLPVDRLHLITRYEGLSDRRPKIDKLGSQSWRAVKTKVKEEVWKVAQELLDIYAKRELRKGQRFSAPAEMYQELEESFAYDETPGQDKAITETITDLTSDKPMDRLVCGDVGYGKTEVAVRAAFKVVEDGYQVAVLVPTTVLSEQHLKTFRERLDGFGITVECINRFRSASNQKKMVRELRTGKIDIIIGTHRLLSKDIEYKRLGLLIVDEEHRFGVTHKEKIKKIKAEVDILTLTATPIPRTLQLSLLGIRDLSVISSPPEHRRPVKTFVARYDELVIKEAVIKEMNRGGQIFVVHNRVKSIDRMAALIEKLVPAARVGVGHGQMHGKDLEEVMVAFVNKEIDVMVCTTIIESGLDIPSANTIIINRADQLGLAEIYQLRGRVGRSSLQSYAYLLVPSIEHLSKDSKERLRALMDFSELGGGFKLAMSDLQIRGGGNILGVSQSGHIAAIGYDLYLDLLQKTIGDIKKRAGQKSEIITADDLDPEINLQISAYIPQTYIGDINQRYQFYRRISSLVGEDGAAMADLQDELVDRFGTLPQETRNLFDIVGLKKELIPLGITKLEKGKDSLVFSLLPETPINPEKLLSYIQTKHTRKNTTARLTPDSRLILPCSTGNNDDLFKAMQPILHELKQLHNESIQ